MIFKQNVYIIYAIRYNKRARRHIIKKIIFLISLVATTTLSANKMSELAKELNLIAGTKASSQWERIFSSDRRIKKYKLDTISLDKLENLKLYLIKHAADSDQPIVPGL